MTRKDSSSPSGRQHTDTTTTEQSTGWSRPVKLVVSGLIAFHILAVVLSPASTRPSSGLAQAGWDRFQPYIEFMYLDHGYRFFAPEPGPSTLISYTVNTADGKEISGRFPDLANTWPRLLYHRYFMLTENMNTFAVRDGDDFELVAPNSYARHLCAKYNGETVGLTRITHRLPTMEMVAEEGTQLNAPASYFEESLGQFDREGKRLP